MIAATASEAYERLKHTNVGGWVDRNIAFTLIVVLASAGAALLFYATRWGPWVFSDSTAYIVSARNLARGDGLGMHLPSGRFQTTVGHPPFYHLTLGFLMTVGLAELDAARLVSLLAYGFGILTFGTILSRMSWPRWLAVAAPVFVFGHPLVFDIYAGAISEPVYITLTLAGLTGVAVFAVRHRACPWGTVASVCLGLAWLARYPGFAGVVAASVSIFLFKPVRLRRRLLVGSTVGLTASLPMLGWLFWLLALRNGEPPREIMWDVSELPLRLQMLRGELVEVLWNWIPFTGNLPLYPYRVRLLALVLMVALLALPVVRLVALGRTQTRAVGGNKSALVLGLLALTFAACHVAILFFTVAFSDHVPNLDARVFSPLLVSGLLLLVADLALLAAYTSRPQWSAFAGLLILLTLVIDQFPDTWRVAQNLHESGRGFTSVRWRESGLLEPIEELPLDIDIVSNDPAPIMFWTDRVAHRLPLLDHPPPDPADIQPFGKGSGSALEARFQDGNAVLVLFDSVYWQLHPTYGGATESAIRQHLRGLMEYVDAWDGTVYVSSTFEPP